MEIKLKKVYQAINEVQAEMAISGISKDQRNSHQGYQFRGIDDVYNSISKILAEKKLCILPSMFEHKSEQFTTAKGGVSFRVIVGIDYKFVSAEDDSEHIVRTYGEAIDTSDKATNKAMSAAYKYMCIQSFCIPIVGDEDADKHSPQVESSFNKEQPISEEQAIEMINKAETMQDLSKVFTFIRRNLKIGSDKDRIVKAKDARKASIEYFEKSANQDKNNRLGD